MSESESESDPLHSAPAQTDLRSRTPVGERNTSLHDRNTNEVSSYRLYISTVSLESMTC